MFFIDANLPIWNRDFTSFTTCLLVIERELYKGTDNNVSCPSDSRHLWTQIVDAGSIFLGETQCGPLYIGRCDTPSGTTYYTFFKED